MIYDIKFTSGFPTQFHHLKNRLIEFSPGFNIVYAENGAGKSVLMKTLAAYCGIEKGGWSQISNPAKLASTKVSHFPFAYRAYTPSNITADVAWDGTPTFYNDSEMMSKNDFGWFFDNAKLSEDGITDSAEQMDVMANKPSSGQYRIHKINKIMQVIKAPPDLTRIPDRIADPESAAAEVNYILGLPRNGKMTLLFDEPEKALALPKQLELFDTLRTLAKYFQVIIASHSPFTLFYPEANLIDYNPGYVDKCRDLVVDYICKKKKKK